MSEHSRSRCHRWLNTILLTINDPMVYDLTRLAVNLHKKQIRGHTYWYARECRRVDGKPKIVWQKYLGKAEDIVAALGQPQAPAPVTAVVTEFGAVAALFDLAQRLRLVEHVDRHVPAGRGPSGPSVGSFL